ncbi:hypothetical protein F4775DRAFT_579928 [Biscogniauxia sp. FL1348]|nr:hypothetical protein F4775DRAFT_579928 [Biscogniauxia sp. FL1348]
MWWQVGDELTFPGDIFQLSNVNKALWDIFLFQRAVINAESQIDRQPQRPDSLYMAILNRQPLSVIKIILGVYCLVAPF